MEPTEHRDQAFLSVLCALIATSCAALIHVARLGLEGSLLLNALCLSVALSVIFAPHLFPGSIRASTRGRAAVSLICLGLLCGPLLAYFFPLQLFRAYPLVALVGAILALRHFRPTPVQVVVLLVVPPLVAIHLVTTMQSLQHGVNLFGPEFAKLGWFTSSAYFHAAMAHLAQIHGVVTLGLDGLDFLQRYHAGSHLWFGALAMIGGSTPLFSYPLGYLVIVLPVLLFSAGLLIVWSVRDGGRWVRVLLFIAIVAVMERLSFPDFFISESYGAALAILTLSLPLLPALAKAEGRDERAAYWPWLAALILVVPLMVTKVSMGILWAGLMFYWALRIMGRDARTLIFLALLALVLPYPLSISLLDWGRLLDAFPGWAENIVTNAVPIQLFRYLLDEPFNFLIALAPAALLVAMRPRASWASIFQTDPTRAETLELEAVLIVVMIGLIATTLYLGGNDSRYFLVPAQWMAMVLLAASLDVSRDSGVVRWSQRRPYPAALIWGSAFAILLLATAIKVDFNTNSTFETARTLAKALKPADPEGTLLDRDFFRAWLRNARDHNLFDERFAQSLERSPGGRVIHAVDSLLAGRVRNHAAVFITPAQHAAWERRFEVKPFPGTYIPPLPRNCAEPFFVQALTGLPLLQGVPPFWARCSTKHVFGWGHELIWQRLQVTDMDDAALCALARQRAISTVLVLRNVDDPGSNKALDCLSDG